MSKAIHITRAQQAQVAAAREVFRPWGLQTALEMGGKHLMMRITAPNGGTWSLTLACTPKNMDDAVNHTRQQAKRLIRDINERCGVYR